jgi:signal transduction histidine kinase
MFGDHSVPGPLVEGLRVSYNPITRIKAFLAQFTLALKFLTAATIIIVAGMIALSYWVSARIENDVVHHSATAIALNLRGVLEPWKREFDTPHAVSLATAEALDKALMSNAPTSKPRVVKIWANDGTIIYSTNQDIRGHKLAISDSLTMAFKGQLASEFDDLTSDENLLERALFTHFLEIYVPITLVDGGKVVAVAEMYQAADELASDIKLSQMQSALVLALISVIMILVLYTIVGPASRTLVSQRHKLALQVDELNGLLQTTQTLQHQIIVANQNVIQGQERVLTRVSADLHDGPIQLISLALMNTPKVQPPTHRDLSGPAVGKTSIYLKEALAELRELATNLSLPDLNNSDLAGVLEKAVKHHVVCTNSFVDTDIQENLPVVSGALGNCLYRFVQEGLMNSYRHADAQGQKVAASQKDGILTVSISDQGPGFDPATRFGDEKLGLWGLRCRIASVGGDLKISSQSGLGTTLRANFKLANVEVSNG